MILNNQIKPQSNKFLINSELENKINAMEVEFFVHLSSIINCAERIRNFLAW